MFGNPQQRLAAQLNSLTRISKRLSATLLLEDISALVLSEAIANCGAAGGEILLFPDDHRTEVRFTRNPPIPASPDLDEQAIRHNIPATGKIEENTGGKRRNICVLIAPILFEDSVRGLLRLFKASDLSFDEFDETFTTGLSHHVAVAIGNERRFYELRERNTLLQRRTQQIEHFLESSRIFHSERRLEEVYEELVYGIQEGVGCNVVLLSLIENHAGALVLKRVTAAGLPLQRLEELRLRIQPWEAVKPLMREEYRIGGAYFVPQENASFERSQLDIHQVIDLYPLTGSAKQLPSTRERWHEDDLFFIPLRDSQGKPLGLISLTAPIDGLRPDPNTARVLEVFANQAASAIENVQLFHSMWDYALQLQQLHNVSQQTLRERDFDRQLAYILDGLQITGWQRVSLTLRDESPGVTKLVTAGYTDSERKQLKEHQLPTSVWRQRFADDTFQKYRRGNCFFLPGDNPAASVEEVPALPELKNVDPVLGWPPGATLCRPLYDRDQTLIGLLTLSQPQSKQLADENGLQTIDLYAQFAISVVESHRFFSEMQRRSQQLQVLFDASRTLSGTLKQDAILSAMGEHMLRAVGANTYYVYALTRDRRGTIMVRSPSQEQGLQDIEFAAAAPVQRMQLAQTVVDTRRATAAQLSPEEFGSLAAQPEEGVSLAMLPIPLRDELFGLVEVIGANAQFSWTPEKLQLLEAIANQAGTALETAHLVEELDDRVAKRTRALAEEVARVQSILESIADGVLVAQADGTILLANMPTARFLNVARERLIGKTVSDLIGVYGPGADRWAHTLQDWSSKTVALEPHSVVKHQIEIDSRVLSVHVSPVFADGHFFGTITTFRDMTRQAEVDRMKSEFVSNVSHELRTPMTSIKGYTDLLLMGAAGELPSSQRRLLDAIRRNADRLKSLVDDLLEISWIETGQSDLKRENISVADIIENEINDHVTGRIQHEGKSIDFVLDLEADLPPVFADPEKVTRIIMNLVDNAINYTQDGGKVTVRAAAGIDDQGAPAVEMKIMDTGVGISQQYLERIFERFYRVEDGTIQETPGTGLGLSIVRSLVEMHGGEIAVESQLGVGSTFKVLLPCSYNGTPELDAAYTAIADPRTETLN